VGEALQPDLSPYEKLAILRDEIDQTQKQLSSVTRNINTVREGMGKRKYLWSLYPEYYKELPPPEGAKELPNLEKRRRILEQLEERLQNEKNGIEALLQGREAPQVQQAVPPRQAPSPRQQPQQAPPGQQRRAKFAAFDEFNQDKRHPKDNG